MSEVMAEILENPKLQKEFSQQSLKIAAAHDFRRTLEQFENIYRRVKMKKADQSGAS